MSDQASCSRLPVESPLGSVWESDFEDDDDEEKYEDLNPGKRTAQEKALIREALKQYQAVQASWITTAMQDCNIDRPIMDINDLLDEVMGDFKAAKLTEIEEAKRYQPSKAKPTLAKVAKISYVTKQNSTPLIVVPESSPKKSFKDALTEPAKRPGTAASLPSVKKFLEPLWTTVGKKNKPVPKTRNLCRMDEDRVMEDTYCEETDSDDRLSGLTEK